MITNQNYAFGTHTDEKFLAYKRNDKICSLQLLLCKKVGIDYVMIS